MTPDDLRHRTRKFAVDTIRFCEQLPSSRAANVIAEQLLRAATSVGANYRAACRGRSRAEFIARLGVAIEEADESAYWLDIAADARITTREAAAPLRQEAEELTRIFVRSRATARGNHQSANSR